MRRGIVGDFERMTVSFSSRRAVDEWERARK